MEITDNQWWESAAWAEPYNLQRGGGGEGLRAVPLRSHVHRGEAAVTLQVGVAAGREEAGEGLPRALFNSH